MVLGQHHSEEAQLSPSFASGARYQQYLQDGLSKMIPLAPLDFLSLGLVLGWDRERMSFNLEIKKHGPRWIQDRETSKGVPLEASLEGREQAPTLASFLLSPKEQP